MGANDKVEAAYHGVKHDPDPSLVRTVYAGASPVPSYSERESAFDRMLDRVRAEAKVEAFAEIAGELEEEGNQYADTANRLTGDDNTRYHAYAAARQGIVYKLRKRTEQIRGS